MHPSLGTIWGKAPVLLVISSKDAHMQRGDAFNKHCTQNALPQGRTRHTKVYPKAQAHLQLFRCGYRHRDELVEASWLPECVDLLIPLQHHLFPQADPQDVRVLSLCICQVPQDAAKGLEGGVAKVRGWHPKGWPCLPQGTCLSPWSWAVLSHRWAS